MKIGILRAGFAHAAGFVSGQGTPRYRHCAKTIRCALAAATLFLVSPGEQARAQQVIPATPTSPQVLTSSDGCVNVSIQEDNTGLSAGTYSYTYEVTSVVDTDLFTVTFYVSGDNGTGTLVAKANGTTIMDQSYTVSTGNSFSKTANYDPSAGEDTVTFELTMSQSAFSAMNTAFEISCQPNAGKVSKQSENQSGEVVKAFLAERLDRLNEDGPDRQRALHDRLARANDPAWQEAKTDRHGLAAAAYFDPPAAVRFPAGTGESQKGGASHAMSFGNLADGCWQPWSEAKYSRFEMAGSRNGSFLVGYAGADCRIGSSTYIGFLGQVDWMDDEFSAAGPGAHGVGWMVGPYATTRLNRYLFMDVRAAAGRSQNSVNAGGVSGDFETGRWLVKGRLSGSFNYQAYNFAPEVELSYAQEYQDAYVDSSGATNAAQTVNLGRLAFGPRIVKHFMDEWNNDYRADFSFRGIWDFDAAEATVGGIAYSTKGLRGVAEAGLTFRTDQNVILRLAAKYDGIGASQFRNYGASVMVSIPLN